MPDPLSWTDAAPYLLAALFGGYLLGSIPFGLVLTRLAGLGDIRQMGSGNIGATNVLRTGNKLLAAATLLLDSAKGAAAVLIALNWGPDTMLAAGFGAVLGHLFPVWLGFKGGKGVATTLGVFIALDWRVGLACCAAWLVTALLLRISSLSAMVAMASAAIWAWLIAKDFQLVQFTAVIAIIIIAKHHQNIARLLKGEEPKIGKKS